MPPQPLHLYLGDTQIVMFFSSFGLPTDHIFLENFPTGDIIALLFLRFSLLLFVLQIFCCPPIKYIDISIANKFVSGTRARKRLLLWLEFHISVEEKKKDNLKKLFLQLQVRTDLPNDILQAYMDETWGIQFTSKKSLDIALTFSL